jgi:hypothetical protein
VRPCSVIAGLAMTAPKPVADFENPKKNRYADKKEQRLIDSPKHAGLRCERQ